MSVSKKSLLGAGAAFAVLTGLVVSTVGAMQATIANPTTNQQTPRLLAQGQKTLTIVFPSRADSTDLQNKANAVGAFLSKELGIPVLAQVGADVAVVSEYALNPAYITAEEKSKLRVLHKINGVPAHGIAIDDDVPAPTREKIINALLKLNQSENNKLLSDLYNSTELVRINHDRHLATMRDALQIAGIEP